MDEDKISVILIEDVSSNANQTGKSKSKEESHDDKETSAWNMCHVFSVIIVSVVFLVPITLIPRTNCIFYQSNWYEFNFVAMGLMLLLAANEHLNMAVYFKDKSFLAFRMLFKTYSLFMVTWTIPYVIAYMIWCRYLKYNWPILFLGYNYVVLTVAKPAVMWISFPRNFRRNKDLRLNFRLYCLYIFSGLIFGVLREGVSFLFKALPGYLQWITALLIPLLKRLDTFVQSRFVNRMLGGQDEASKVLLGLSINSAYSFFIAVRLPDAELITVCCIVAVDFLLQLKITYKIVQLHNFVTDGTIRNGNMEKQRMVTKLALAELTEGIVPLVYAIGVSMANYGFNGSLLRDVKNDYWGAKPIDDVWYLFQFMLLLFGVDIFSVLVNSFILATFTKVKLFRELCRIMKIYWYFIVVKFAFAMMMMFAIKDINLGMDYTGEWNWITNDGRLILINNSTDLSNDEKFLLLNLSVL